MSGTCATCGTSVSGVFQALPDAAYHAAGTTSPTEDAIQACQQAAALMTAQQLDPCDPNYDEVLQEYYQTALTQVGQVVSTTPNQNAIQGAFNTVIGTSAPGTPVISNIPPASNSMNLTYIIGVVVLLALGFFLVFR